MGNEQPNRLSLIALSLFVGLVLSILPMSLYSASFRPDWTVLVLLYWVLALPERVNIGSAWFVGLLLDILLGSPLGAHALACALIGFFTAVNNKTIRHFSLPQQTLIIGLFLALYHLIVFWVSYFITDLPFSPSYLLPVLIDLPIWMLLFRLLHWYRNHFQIR